MSKNKGGREVRKPKQDKKTKNSAQTMADLNTVRPVADKVKARSK